MNKLDVPQGQFTLNRYPLKKDDTLRAWDAADEYILLHLAEQNLTTKKANTLILNDAFGALSIALSEYAPCIASDSYVSHQSILKNLELNNVATNSIELVDSLHPLSGPYDLIVIKIPKNLSMLEDQLYRIREHCTENTIILASAMAKHIHTSTLKLFEKIIGETRTSLARKKARLVMANFDADLKPGKSPYPGKYKVETTGDTYINHANVFSREKLDIGSRFMIEHIPQSQQYKNILDLACGNGILGITAAKLNPHATLTFVDESYMAVESARENATSILGHTDNFIFKVTDCLQDIADNRFDLILNNPPFHQQHVVGDFIAWKMFKDSKHKLKPGGEIVIVGNRHLGYHVKLKKIFGNCKTIASNKKFVILKSVKK